MQSCPTLCDPLDCSLQALLSMGFSRQEYWSGLPFPSPGNLPNPGIEPGSPALQADALLSEPPGSSHSKGEIVEDVPPDGVMSAFSRDTQAVRTWVTPWFLFSGRYNGLLSTVERQELLVLVQVILLGPPSSLSHTSSGTDQGLPALPEPSEGWLLLGL